MAFRLTFQITEESEDCPKEDSVNITFSIDNTKHFARNQIQNSIFKSDNVDQQNFKISKISKTNKLVDRNSNSKKASKKISSRKTKYIKVDDSYSFTYSISRNEIKSQSDVFKFSPIKTKPKSKKVRKSIPFRNNDEYKPTFLVKNRMIKIKCQTQSQKKKTWANEKSNKKPNSSSIKLRPRKKVRKSAYSRLINETFDHDNFKTGERKTKKITTKNKQKRISLLKKNEIEIKEEFERQSNLLFFEKSMNRFSNLKNLQNVIAKSQKQIRKSKSKRNKTFNIKILSKFR